MNAEPVRSPTVSPPRKGHGGASGKAARGAGKARSARPRPARPGSAEGAPPYLNRELAWLDYARRVLWEARDGRNALLDRVNFLTIFASMLDEFFQIRISGLRQQVHAGSTKTSPDGRTAAEQLEACREKVLGLVAELTTAWVEIRSALAAEGIEIVKYSAIPEHHELLRRRFSEEIYPVLTPLAVDPGHPFPYISTLSLSIAVGLRDPETDERRFARVKVPQILPRLYQVESNRFVLLDQIIEANLDLLFSGMIVEEHHMFRVTRNADLALEEAGQHRRHLDPGETSDRSLTVIQADRDREGQRRDVREAMPRIDGQRRQDRVDVAEEPLAEGEVVLGDLAVVEDLDAFFGEALAELPVDGRLLGHQLQDPGPRLGQLLDG